MRVLVTAPAKINLRLAVLAREASGYHSLETIFCGISLADSIEIRAAPPGIQLRVVGSIDTGDPEKNLVVRAARLFHEMTGIAPAIEIELLKRIPSAAGLGGGSSDAAATLRGLNELLGRPADAADLMEWAGRLGSDVPFFLASTPFALAWNRGDRLLALAPPPSLPLLVVSPAAGMDTGRAFQRLAERRGSGAGVEALELRFQDLMSWNALAAIAHNDFESVAAEGFTEFEPVRDLLRLHGARIALLAGSGSSIYGLFDTLEDRESSAAALSAEGFSATAAETLEAWPSPIVRD